MFIDPLGLNITLIGEKEYWVKSFEELQALTDDTLIYDEESGVVTIYKYGEGDKVTGTKLVRELIENENFDLKIQRNGYTKEGVKIGTQIMRGDDKGALVNMNDEFNNNPSIYYLVYNEDGTTSLESMKDTPSFIILGHELIHAYHYMTGTFNHGKGGLRFYVYEGVLYQESIPTYRNNDEFETIGLGYVSPTKMTNSKSICKYYIPSHQNVITENTLRSEHGIRLRAAHDIDPSILSTLNRN